MGQGRPAGEAMHGGVTGRRPVHGLLARRALGIQRGCEAGDVEQPRHAAAMAATFVTRAKRRAAVEAGQPAVARQQRGAITRRQRADQPLLRKVLSEALVRAVPTRALELRRRPPPAAVVDGFQRPRAPRAAHPLLQRLMRLDLRRGHRPEQLEHAGPAEPR